MLTRHIGVKVILDGKDISQDLSTFLQSATYEDVSDGETDTIELELDDAKRLFIGDWFPTRGSTLEVEFWRENWREDNQIDSLPLGVFEIDEVTNSFPPTIAKVKANSCPQNSALRQVDESRAWENFKLSEIAKDIATKAGVELYYDTDDDPTIKRAEQGESSALSFLEKLCRDNGLCLKFADGKIIIFDEEKAEEQDPIAVFEYGKSAIKNFSATATLTEVYKSCEVNYKDGKANEKYSAKVEDETRKNGKTLKINQQVDSQAAAEKLAKKKLHDKNKDEFKLNLTVVGDFSLLSGRVIELKNFGFYDGKWLIERARHKVGGGYDVSLECHKCGATKKPADKAGSAD